MHRSGTSVLTGALALCGVWAGDEAELTAANAENPKGFWERRDMRALCDRLLRAGGAEWWRPTGFDPADFDPAAVPEAALETARAALAEIRARLDAHAPWVVKEPRLCLLLPLLRPALSDPICLHIHRDPLEVARSLRARNGFGIAEGLALWEVYTRAALKASAGLPRIALLQEDFLADPALALADLAAQLAALGLEGLKAPDPAALAEFVSADLRRQRATPGEADAYLSPGQARLWAALRAGQPPEPDGFSRRRRGSSCATSTPAPRSARRCAPNRRARPGSKRRAPPTRRNSAAQSAALREALETAEQAARRRQEESAARERALRDEIAAAVAAGERDQARLAAELTKERDLSAELTAELTEERDLSAQLTAGLAGERNLSAQLTAEIAELRKIRQRLDQSLNATAQALNLARKDVKALRASTSWRITAPIRGVLDRVKGTRRTLSRGLRPSFGAGFGAAARRLGQRLKPAVKPVAIPLARRLRPVVNPLAKLLRRRGRVQDDRLIQASGLFDPAWYLAEYPDVAKAGVDPLDHFLKKGWREGRNPSAGFDTLDYLKSYPAVARARENPLLDYLRDGRRRGRTAREPVSQQGAAIRAQFDPAASAAWVAALRAHPAAARVRADPPLVTVIVPSRDRIKLLPRAIDSVLAQSYARWEMVVVDDGSTDGTAGTVRAAYADPRIRVVSTPGLGVSGARNAGLAEAAGDLVAYLDSDNAWLPEYLELMVAEFERSGASSVYAVLKVREEKTRAKTTEIWYRAIPFDYEELEFSNYIDLNIFMHRIEMYRRFGGFDTELRRVVDWDLILRYVRHDPVSFANFIGAEYDHSDRGDRLTVRELPAFKNIVRNKHWVDWEAEARRLTAQDRGQDHGHDRGHDRGIGARPRSRLGHPLYPRPAGGGRGAAPLALHP